MQIAPAPEASTVSDVAAVTHKPCLKSHCIDVLAAKVIGPRSAVVTAPAVSPAPIVILIAAPLLIVIWSIIIDLPATAAFNSSHALASALVALTIKPNFPGCGVVTAIATSHPLFYAITTFAPADIGLKKQCALMLPSAAAAMKLITPAVTKSGCIMPTTPPP